MFNISLQGVQGSLMDGNHMTAKQMELDWSVRNYSGDKFCFPVYHILTKMQSSIYGGREAPQPAGLSFVPKKKNGEGEEKGEGGGGSSRSACYSGSAPVNLLILVLAGVVNITVYFKVALNVNWKEFKEGIEVLKRCFVTPPGS